MFPIRTSHHPDSRSRTSRFLPSLSSQPTPRHHVIRQTVERYITDGIYIFIWRREKRSGKGGEGRVCRHIAGRHRKCLRIPMARSGRGRRWISSHARSTPYPLPSNHPQIADKDDGLKKPCKLIKDWEDATCSVCMEFPHKAVLLLCSSHDKGCRPYICGTSHRYSNCLDQFKKAYMKEETRSGLSSWPLYDKPEVAELACPLCRGQVKGWTVVEPARDYLNMKKRSCMQDGCSYVGTYKELRRHVKAVHPSAKPRQVDPALQQRWRSLEQERDREDVMSTIRSTMPGAVVLGDYVLERNSAFDAIEDAQIISSLVAIFQQFGNPADGFGARLRMPPRRHIHLSEEDGDTSPRFSSMAPSFLISSDEEDDDYDRQMVGRQVQGLRAARRRRRRSNRNNTVDI